VSVGLLILNSIVKVQIGLQDYFRYHLGVSSWLFNNTLIGFIGKYEVSSTSVLNAFTILQNVGAITLMT